MVHIFFPLSAARRAKAVRALVDQQQVMLGGCVVQMKGHRFCGEGISKQIRFSVPSSNPGLAITKAEEIALRLVA